MTKIFVYGCGGVGTELAEHLSNDPRFDFQGFIDDNPTIKNCMGFESHTLEEILVKRGVGVIKAGDADDAAVDTADHVVDVINIIISIGEPAIRESLSQKISSYDFLKEVTVDFSDHFDPNYSIVEAGTLLHKCSYISVNTYIGKCCMINKGTLVGHGCVIGDYSVLAPNVTLGGDVRIGNCTYIGSNAVLRNGVRVGKNAIIGMGSVVIDDVEDEVVVVGNPAKEIRKNEGRRVFTV